MEYISIKELSEYINMTTRGLRKWCASSKVQYHTVRGVGGSGGMRYEILVSSLPEDLRKKVADKSALISPHPTAQPPLTLGFSPSVKADLSATSPHPSPTGRGSDKVTF